MTQDTIVDYSLIASGRFNVESISVNHQIITPPNTYVRYANEHRHDRFVYIVSGRCRFDIFNEKPVYAKEGSIVFIPHNIAYRSDWSELPNGEVYSINYIMRDFTSKQISICPEIHCFENCEQTMTKGFFEEAREIFKNESYGYELNAKCNLLKLMHTIVCSQNSLSHTKVEKAIRYIQNNFTEEISIPDLAEMCNLGECMFRRSFKLETGSSPLKYKNELRLKKAYELLATENYTVIKAMEATGFYDASYFNKVFKAQYGHSPSEVRKKYIDAKNR